MYELNEATFLILIGIIAMLIIVIILLVLNRKYKNIKIIKTTNHQEFEEFMKENNFPKEIIQQMQDGKIISSTKTIRTVKYINGEKVSDTTETSSNLPTTNFCPNCGTKIENSNNPTCPYCNTNYTITK